MSSDLPTETIESRIVALAIDMACRMARWLEMIGEYDARGGARGWGFRTTAEWLATYCDIGPRAARDHVRVAQRLRQMPRIRAAFGAGELSYSKARALTRASAEEDESRLLDLARELTAAQLERHLRALRSAPSGDLAVANDAHERRTVDWWWGRDGSLELRGRVGADEGAALVEALQTGAEALHPRAPGPRPARGARCADALTELVFSGAPRAQVLLHVDPASLGEVCALEDGPAVPPDTARRLTCDADVVDGHGRTRRTVSPALRRSVELRDRHCRYPGCDRRHGLHAHHIDHWIHGGPTDRENLALLCRFHHRLVHEEDFRMWRAEDGALAFARPDGHRVIAIPDRRPPPALRAAA